MLKQFFFIFFLFFLLSCSNTENNKNIIGKWKGVEWLVEKQPGNYDASSASFSFDDKEHYNFTYKNNIENGTYKVENKMLFTKPEGGTEIMVLIQKLSGDTMIFEMNRGGVKEELTLLREK